MPGLKIAHTSGAFLKYFRKNCPFGHPAAYEEADCRELVPKLQTLALKMILDSNALRYYDRKTVSASLGSPSHDRSRWHIAF